MPRITVFEWVGDLNPEHDRRWVINYLAKHKGETPSPWPATLFREDEDYDGEWEIPPGDEDGNKIWVKIMGPEDVAVTQLGNKRVRVVVEVIPEGVADCGHSEYADHRCAEMVCSNYYQRGIRQ